MTDSIEDPRFALYRRNLDVLARGLAERDARIARLKSQQKAPAASSTPKPVAGRAAILCSDPAAARAARTAGLRAALEAAGHATDVVAPTWEPAPEGEDAFGTAPGERALACGDFAGFHALALTQALEAAHDLVLVRGARLPGLLMAALIHRITLCR